MLVYTRSMVASIVGHSGAARDISLDSFPVTMVITAGDVSFGVALPYRTQRKSSIYIGVIQISCFVTMSHPWKRDYQLRLE